MTALTVPGSVALRGLALLLVGMFIAVTWLVILPLWASQPKMAAALRAYDEQGINAAATFYTDSPAALTNLQSIRELQQEQPGLFWQMSKP